MNLQAIHYALLVCAALAAGLPQLEVALPVVATPYLKGATAILVLLTAVLGAVSPSAGKKDEAKSGDDSKKPPRLPPPPAALAAVAVLAIVAAMQGCKDASSPVADADASAVIEAGTTTTGDACSFLEGITDSGVVRNICATVAEIWQVVSFIMTLRPADAGAAAAASCVVLPNTSFCATKAEIAKGIEFLMMQRRAALYRDGGVK